MAGEVSNSKTPIVDSHVHVWKNDAKFPWAVDLSAPPNEDATPEMLLRVMDQESVQQTVIVHVIYFRWDCRYTADSVHRYRDRFMGVCRVDPQSENAIADLNRWVTSGLRGVRLSPGTGPEGDWIHDQPRMDAICARAAALKVPLCILCGTARLPDVEPLILRHADRLDVCIDHMADCPIDQPGELQNLLALAKYKRVYVKLSHLWSLSRQAYPYQDTHEQVHKIYDAFGPQRLMWGTDWPVINRYCGYGKALSLYRDEIKFFNDDDRRWILGGTALKLWPANI